MTAGERMVQEVQQAIRRQQQWHRAGAFPLSRVHGAPPRRSRTRSTQHLGLVGSPDRVENLPHDGFASGPDGVICGCHTLGCATCKRTGGCGWIGCETCVAAAYIHPGWPDLVSPLDPTHIVDAHAHDSGTSYSDVVCYAIGNPSDAETQVARLTDLAALRPGVRAMFISAQFNPGYGPGFVTDSRYLNIITNVAASAAPDYFYPFVMIQPDELADPLGDPAAEADYWLNRTTYRRFSGVGELFIHGHHEHYDGDPTNPRDNLVDVCMVARAAAVPVRVHWEIGRVDPDEYSVTWSSGVDGAHIALRSAEANFEQLCDLLDVMSFSLNFEAPFRLVLCHCGAGPANSSVTIPSLGGMLDEERADWLARLDILLVDYPNVTFDLAGMQVGDASTNSVAVQRLVYFDPVSSTDLPTAVGTELLARIADYPDRFMLGTDSNNAVATTVPNVVLGMDDFGASIAKYLQFLQMGSLTPYQQYQVRIGNALELVS